MALSQDKIIEYTLKLYDALAEEAKLEELEGKDKPVMVYRGRITHLYRGLEISMAYYSPIKNTLSEVGAVQYLRAGNKVQDSCIILFDRPTEEKLAAVTEPEHLTARLDRATLERRIIALEQRIGDMPIQKTMVNFETRLRKLEGKVAK